MVYIVFGTPGAGKSSIMKKFVEMHPNAHVVNFGTLMYEIAKHQQGISSRDELRNLPRSRFRELQNMAANEILKLGNDIIIDSHASIKTVDGYHPGFPFYLLSKLNIDAFIYIRANPEEILERRKRDTTRKRDVETLDDVQFHDMINLAMVCSYSSYANAPIKFITNREGKLDEAVDEFKKCVRL
ncbi:MAG: adenylate kinase [Candidatus Micrarchaeia archaeon]